MVRNYTQFQTSYIITVNILHNIVESTRQCVWVCFMLGTVVQANKSGENDQQKLLEHTLKNIRKSLMPNQKAVQLVIFSAYSLYFDNASKGIPYPFPNGIIH